MPQPARAPAPKAELEAINHELEQDDDVELDELPAHEADATECEDEDPEEREPGPLTGQPAGKKRGARQRQSPPPVRRARLLVDLQADTPQELARVLKRLLSCALAGHLREDHPKWSEHNTKVTATATLEIREFSLAGEAFTRALETWQEVEAKLAASAKAKR